MTSIIAKLFKNGQSQAVRIPKKYEFKGIDEVTIHREGNGIVIMPARKSWASFSKLPKADEDFMSFRPSLMDEGRVKL